MHVLEDTDGTEGSHTCPLEIISCSLYADMCSIMTSSHPEFTNRFDNPITNGQCADSSVEDIKLMRYRAHTLHKLLQGFIHRRSHALMKDKIPPKVETVLSVGLTPIQAKLYQQYLDHCAKQSERGLLKSFALLLKLWNHPDVLRAQVESAFAPHYAAQKARAEAEAAAAAGLAPPAHGGYGVPAVAEQPKVVDSTDVVGKVANSITAHDLVWAHELITPAYTANMLAQSNKYRVMFALLDQAMAAGDKVAVFSQSVQCLDHVEAMLNAKAFRNKTYTRDKQFYRIDGQIQAKVRQRMIADFNKKSSKIKLFLISTRAGGIGINLTGANRVIMLDVAWNPSHDAQAVCRVYRFGQPKKTYIYRLVASGTMERKIYDRQLFKTAMANRVVDKMQQYRHLHEGELGELYKLVVGTGLAQDVLDQSPLVKNDKVLQLALASVPMSVTENPIEHTSVLVENIAETLTEEEKKQADEEFQGVLEGLVPEKVVPARSGGANGASGAGGGGARVLGAPAAHGDAGGGAAAAAQSTYKPPDRDFKVSPELHKQLVKQVQMLVAAEFKNPGSLNIPGIGAQLRDPKTRPKFERALYAMLVDKAMQQLAAAAATKKQKEAQQLAVNKEAARVAQAEAAKKQKEAMQIAMNIAAAKRQQEAQQLAVATARAAEPAVVDGAAKNAKAMALLKAKQQLQDAQQAAVRKKGQAAKKAAYDKARRAEKAAQKLSSGRRSPRKTTAAAAAMSVPPTVATAQAAGATAESQSAGARPRARLLKPGQSAAEVATAASAASATAATAALDAKRGKGSTAANAAGAGAGGGGRWGVRTVVIPGEAPEQRAAREVREKMEALSARNALSRDGPTAAAPSGFSQPPGTTHAALERAQKEAREKMEAMIRGDPVNTRTGRGSARSKSPRAAKKTEVATPQPPKVTMLD